MLMPQNSRKDGRIVPEWQWLKDMRTKSNQDPGLGAFAISNIIGTVGKTWMGSVN